MGRVFFCFSSASPVTFYTHSDKLTVLTRSSPLPPPPPQAQACSPWAHQQMRKKGGCMYNARARRPITGIQMMRKELTKTFMMIQN